MAGGSLGKLFVELGIDTAALEKGIGKAKSDIGGLGATLQKHGKAIGAAMAGAGVGLTALTNSSMKMNAALGTTALQLGISTKDMRNLAIETSNVTFPLSEVQGSFDLLTRAGLTNADQIAVCATAFDTLGDAIGMPASEVTGTLIPAFNAFGIPLEDAGKHTDALTYLVRNSTVELSDFGAGMNYLAADIGDLGLSMEEYIGVLMAMEAKGVKGTAATRELRKAVSASDGDISLLYESLGLTNEEVATYTDGVKNSTGMTQKFADAQNKEYSTMDKIKHSLSEMTLKYGSLLQPVEALGPAMTGLGTIIIAASVINWAHAASAWAMIAPYLLIIAPIVAVIAILAALELKFGLVTKAIQFATGVVSSMVSAFETSLGSSDALVSATKDVADGVEEEGRLMGLAEVAADALTDAQKNVADSAAEVDKLTSAYDELQGAISDVLGLTEDASDQGRAIEHATFGLEDAEKNYAEAVKKYGANSDEAARADLRRRDAEDRLDDAQKKQIEISGKIAAADTKKTGILVENGVTTLDGFKDLMADKKAEHQKDIDAETVAEQVHTDAVGALTEHRADMQIKEQKRAEEASISSFGRIMNALKGMDTLGAGKAMITALADGMTSGIDTAVEAAKTVTGRIREFFTGSDAKVGPLSDVTASGAALMDTFGKGMASANVDLSHVVAPILPQTIMAAAPAAPAAASSNVSNSSSISMGDVHLSNDFDFMALMEQIDRYQATKRTQRGVT